MPLFELVCKKCGTVVEVLVPSRKVLDRQKPVCLKCGDRKHKVMPPKVGKAVIK